MEEEDGICVMSSGWTVINSPADENVCHDGRRGGPAERRPVMMLVFMWL